MKSNTNESSCFHMNIALSKLNGANLLRSKYIGRYLQIHYIIFNPIYVSIISMTSHAETTK